MLNGDKKEERQNVVGCRIWGEGKWMMRALADRNKDDDGFYKA